MTPYLLALLLGVVAGLRTFTPIALVAWAAHFDWLEADGTFLDYMAMTGPRVVLTFIAIAELINDKRPSTPSRTVPAQFGARLMSGALCGAAIGLTNKVLLGCLIAGIFGAVIGTLGGRAARGRLAARLGSDPPAAFLEDAVAIGGAVLIGFALR